MLCGYKGLLAETAIFYGLQRGSIGLPHRIWRIEKNEIWSKLLPIERRNCSLSFLLKHLISSVSSQGLQVAANQLDSVFRTVDKINHGRAAAEGLDPYRTRSRKQVNPH